MEPHREDSKMISEMEGWNRTARITGIFGWGRFWGIGEGFARFYKTLSRVSPREEGFVFFGQILPQFPNPSPIHNPSPFSFFILRLFFLL